MKLLWLGYLVYSLGNCVMKLYIETGLTTPSAAQIISRFDVSKYIYAFAMYINIIMLQFKIERVFDLFSKSQTSEGHKDTSKIPIWQYTNNIYKKKQIKICQLYNLLHGIVSTNISSSNDFVLDQNFST